MTSKIEIECRVQYRRGGKWFTIDEAGEAAIVLEGEMINLLERWAGWFEARQFETAERGLCAVCLHDVSEQGHSSGCIYAMTRDAFNEYKWQGQDEQ